MTEAHFFIGRSGEGLKTCPGHPTAGSPLEIAGQPSPSVVDFASTPAVA